MSDFQMPSFDFTGDIGDEYLPAGGSRKTFDPGSYELQVLSAYYAGPLADPKWGKIKVTLGTGTDGDDRTIFDTICIPLTSDLSYQKPGNKPTQSMAYLTSFPFFGALGKIRFNDRNGNKVDLINAVKEALMSCKKGEVEVYDFDTKQRVTSLVPVVKALIGKTVTAQLGYEGNYFDRDKDTGFWGVYNKGEIVIGSSGPIQAETFDDVKLLASENAIDTSKLRVLKYFTKPKAQTIVEVSDAFNDFAI